MHTPLNFSQMKALSKSYQKFPHMQVAYGTRSGKFHLVDKDDRDFNTNWCMTLDTFAQMTNETIAIKLLTGARSI